MTCQLLNHSDSEGLEYRVNIMVTHMPVRREEVKTE